MLLDRETSIAVWDRVYQTFHFCPSTNTSVVPFSIALPHVVYDICGTSKSRPDQFDQLITAAFIRCTLPGERLYAMDWQHSSFLFDPRIPEQMCLQYVEDTRCFSGGYHAFFPDYFPDGDYYFFIDEQFRFAYLSYPWRQEVWIAGEILIHEFAKIAPQLGWRKKEDFSQ